MSKEAEKLAAALDSRVVRNWVHSTGTSPKATGFKHDAECQQAAALIRLQAEQIRELRTALERCADWMDRLQVSGDAGFWDWEEGDEYMQARAALSNTKEEI